MRAEIAALPDGRYAGEDKTDNDCFDQVDCHIRVALTVAGGHLTVDFTGTDAQMKGFKNSSLANTFSAVYTALYSFLAPDLPGNEGTFRAVTVVAPTGSLVNPLPPAPMTMNTIAVATEIIHAVWQALGQADPARACAFWGKNSGPIMSGRGDDGKPFVMYHWSGAIGAGAVDGRDGFNANGGLVALGRLQLPDVELYEQSYPVRFVHQEFRADGGGAGLYRGGTGTDYAIDIETTGSLSLRGEGLRTPSGKGIGGGGTGLAGEMRVRYGDGHEVLPPKYGLIPVEPMRLEVTAAGGGGWGDPLARDPERVLRDVRDGLVSRGAAERDYGVALTPDGRAVDAAATERLRNGRRG
jgi:N-methylhydantoinase B